MPCAHKANGYASKQTMNTPDSSSAPAGYKHATAAFTPAVQQSSTDISSLIFSGYFMGRKFLNLFVSWLLPR